MSDTKRRLSLSSITSRFIRKKKLDSVTAKSFKFKTSGLDAYTHDASLLRKYEIVYLRDGVVFASIHHIASNAIGSSWDLFSESSDALEIIEQFTSKLDFDKFLYDTVVHMLVYGDAYIEKVRNANNQIVDLNLVDPKTMEIITNQHGEIEQYIQEVETEHITFTPEEMVNVNLYTLPGSPYGISLIQPNYSLVLKKMDLDDAIISAILRHGFPKFHVTIGKAEKDLIPAPDIVEEIASEFKDIASKNEFITSDLINIKNIDVRGIENIDMYMDYILGLLTAGFFVPMEALGLGKGSTEASGKVRQRLFERFLRSIQRRVESIITHNIFTEILKTELPDTIVRLKFRDVSPIDESESIKWVEPLLKTEQGAFGILSKEEIRRTFNLPESIKEEV